MNQTTDADAEKPIANPAKADSLKAFLEEVHPGTMRTVDNLWAVDDGVRLIETPDIRLHCSTCEGKRTFRSRNNLRCYLKYSEFDFNVDYTCGDCQENEKRYSLFVRYNDGKSGDVYKYGELPPFGIPVPNKLLRLFGKDSSLFMKGRQCENLGYGVAAFAYYRRVVENHKNDIFDEIIKVCRTVNAPNIVIDELEQAKREIAFTRSVEDIKSALPQGLLINGHNPLLALHGALSVGLHDGTDEECLSAAQAVRLVLTDLVEKISTLKQDNRELNDAVQLLLTKKS